MPSPVSVSTKLQRIAELARNAPDMAFTSLAHHVDLEFLRHAYDLTRKDGATGVDRQTATEFAANLEANLGTLLTEFKSGRYRAAPVRRVHIPKDGTSGTRPLGIPSFRDKVLQRAVALLLGAVYEQDFLPCSYGFRPGRSAHDALRTLHDGFFRSHGGWVLDVDIQGFFDSLDHGHLRRILDQRVKDGVIRRTIGKWLNAGVLEEGKMLRPDTGTPQGGVVSPLLSNIYLHEVVDTWFEGTVKSALTGSASMVRFADDFVMIFSRESDARRVHGLLRERLEAFGLRLHPTKTRLLHFAPPGSDSGGATGGSAGSSRRTFDFLGFTFYWGKSRRKTWVPKWKTSSTRFALAMARMQTWRARHRHAPVPAQHAALCQKLRGHYGYFGVSHNFPALARALYALERIWHKWLCRRSQRSYIPWKAFSRRLAEDLALPRPRIVHRLFG